MLKGQLNQVTKKMKTLGSRALWNFCHHPIQSQKKSKNRCNRTRGSIFISHIPLSWQNQAPLTTKHLDCKPFSPRCVGVMLEVAYIASSHKSGKIRRGLRCQVWQAHLFLTPRPTFLPFSIVSSPAPTDEDSCDMTWGNLSDFTRVTKRFILFFFFLIQKHVLSYFPRPKGNSSFTNGGDRIL